jgi:hypothetical protein
LAWGQQQLADAAGAGVVTVHQLEAGASEPRRATLVVRRAIAKAGVDFIEEYGGGHRRKASQMSGLAIESAANLDVVGEFWIFVID